MDEIEARFELLRWELTELQAAIRSFEATHMQIKGWAVTVGVAAAGVSLSQGLPSVTWLGAFAAVVFMSMDAHRHVFYQRLIRRARDLEDALEGRIVTEVLESGELQVPYLARSVQAKPKRGWQWKVGRELLREAAHPRTFTPYVGILLLMLITAFAA